MHLVMADREFDGHEILHTLDSHDLTYLIPKREYEADLEGIKMVEEHPLSDVGVEPNVELGVNGEVSHEVNFMYVPSTEEDGDYAVFLTNPSNTLDSSQPLCRTSSPPTAHCSRVAVVAASSGRRSFIRRRSPLASRRSLRSRFALAVRSRHGPSGRAPLG